MKPDDELVRFFEKILNFPLADWQEKHLRKIFGTLQPNGKRKYRTTYWEIPKKNGKSSLSAGMALYGLFADGEVNPHVYLAAAARDQTKPVFLPAAQMVQNSPVLKKRCRIIYSTKTILVKGNPNSFLRAVSADAGTQEGRSRTTLLYLRRAPPAEKP